MGAIFGFQFFNLSHLRAKCRKVGQFHGNLSAKDGEAAAEGLDQPVIVRSYRLNGVAGPPFWQENLSLPVQNRPHCLKSCLCNPVPFEADNLDLDLVIHPGAPVPRIGNDLFGSQ